MPNRIAALPVAEPNLTPMIDVLLVLIIVFMVMIVQVYHTMDVQLPEVCANGCAGADPIVLEVLPGPAYRLNRVDVSPVSLPARIAGVYRDRPDKTIEVAGHSGVRYAEVMRAMDIAKASGVRVIGITPKSAYDKR